MRALRTYGSVGGRMGNHRLYPAEKPPPVLGLDDTDRLRRGDRGERRAKVPGTAGKMLQRPCAPLARRGCGRLRWACLVLCAQRRDNPGDLVRRRHEGLLRSASRSHRATTRGATLARARFCCTWGVSVMLWCPSCMRSTSTTIRSQNAQSRYCVRLPCSRSGSLTALSACWRGHSTYEGL